MKRYRVLRFDFDSRPLVLQQNIEEHWDDKTKELWVKNKEDICRELVREFGDYYSQDKLKNFVDIGSKPFSILAFHNIFLNDCRNAFIVGAYYPALTGVCALGERILNHLVLLLRQEFRFTKEYKIVYRKESFDNWTLAIDTLVAWDVLLPEAVEGFRSLETIRNRSIHFRPEVDQNDRSLALEAILLLQDIIAKQFSGFGTQPWFLNTIPGEAYIKKSWEEHPYIKHVYLPNCRLVGPYHNLELQNGIWVALDNNHYPEEEINDDQFSELRLKSRV